MDKRGIQLKIIRKLMSMSPPKWGASHTEEINLTKGLPKHLRGEKVTIKAIDELYSFGFLLKAKKLVSGMFL